MFDKLRRAVVDKIVAHLCEVQAAALVHLVLPILVQLAAEVREAVASGRGMTNDEIEARAVVLLAPLLEAEEEAVGSHITSMVQASQQANANAATPMRVPPLTLVPDPTTGPTPIQYVRAGYAPEQYPPHGYDAKLNDGTLVKDGDESGLTQARAEAMTEREAMDAEAAASKKNPKSTK